MDGARRLVHRSRAASASTASPCPATAHTKNFFESFGLVARAIVVHRTLP